MKFYKYFKFQCYLTTDVKREIRWRQMVLDKPIWFEPDEISDKGLKEANDNLR